MDDLSFLDKLLDPERLRQQLSPVLQALQEAQQAHYLNIADTTPYSPYTLNVIRFKGGTGVRYGGPADPGYAIDTGALFDDLADWGALVDGQDAIAISAGSERPYADYQEQLLQSKTGASLLLMDGEALEIVCEGIGDIFDNDWENL